MNKLRVVSQILQRINTTIFLHTGYVLGIGVVSVIGRTMGIKFLQEEATKTNWKPPTGSQDPERMF